jgi:hypothetical protein
VAVGSLRASVKMAVQSPTTESRKGRGSILTGQFRLVVVIGACLGGFGLSVFRPIWPFDAWNMYADPPANSSNEARALEIQAFCGAEWKSLALPSLLPALADNRASALVQHCLERNLCDKLATLLITRYEDKEENASCSGARVVVTSWTDSDAIGDRHVVHVFGGTL